MTKRFRRRDGGPAGYDRPTIHAAFQALEDYIQDSKQTRPPAGTGTWNNAINDATSPFTFNLAQKDDLLLAWSRVKANTT